MSSCLCRRAFTSACQTLQLLMRAEAQISGDQTAAALSGSLQAGWAESRRIALRHAKVEHRAPPNVTLSTIYTFKCIKSIGLTVKGRSDFSPLCKVLVGGVTECLPVSRPFGPSVFWGTESVSLCK